MSEAYIIGVCVGAVVLIPLLCKWLHQGSGVKKILDEKQVQARGNGYKYGFFTFLILDLIFACLFSIIDIFADNAMIILFGIIIMSVSVYASYCIVNDAYIGLNENPRRIMFTLTVMGLVNAMIVVLEMSHGNPFILNGEISSWVTNLFCAVMAFFLDGVYFFHQKKLLNEED